ncbi:hypothetical protein C2S52_010272 [Perilla frutescens var. hirtella]|nr:hypothetical protein C2S52_010272 [Perilla frutescens var. hirtella]
MVGRLAGEVCYFLELRNYGMFVVGGAVEGNSCGLGRSGHRFLWVVHSPPEEKGELFIRPSELDSDALLPARFVERTKDWGLMVKSWAPQVAVLNHEAIGGFVTHCASEPMAAWPLYAEQHFNRVLLTQELGLTVRWRWRRTGSWRRRRWRSELES